MLKTAALVLVLVYAASAQRGIVCNGQGDYESYGRECCSTRNPCKIGQGDCDKDSECAGSLTCGKDNCASPFPSKADCCQTGCSGENACCSAREPCGLGEGDCDHDSECAGDLICAKGYTVGCIQGPNWDSADDCCLHPSSLSGVENFGQQVISGAGYIGVPNTNINVGALAEGITDTFEGWFGRRKK